jgi:hypothetical protein
LMPCGIDRRGVAVAVPDAYGHGLVKMRLPWGGA